MILMALEGLDVARILLATHWLGMLLGLGSAAVADALGLRILLSSRRGPDVRIFTALHMSIGVAILALLFSGAGLAVLRADQWCELPGNMLRAGSVCIPYKIAVKLALMLTLILVALLIDAYLLPLSRRNERPLILHLSALELARTAPIGAASLTCWLSLATIPFVTSLHSWPPLQLLVAILIVWVIVTGTMLIGLFLTRRVVRITDAGAASIVEALAQVARFVRTPVAADGAHAISPTHVSPTRNSPTHAEPATLAATLAASRRTMFGALAISFVINALMLTGPLYMLQVYDRVLTSRSIETLSVLTVLVAGLFAVMGLLDQIRARILSRVAVRLDRTLAPPLLAAAIRVAPSTSRATAQSPLRDLDQIRQFVAGPAPAAMLDLPWAPVYFLIVFLLHPLLGLVAVVGAAVLVILSVLNQLMTRKSMAEQGEASARCDAIVESGWRGAEALRALGMVGAFRQRWLDQHERTLELQLRANDVGNSISAATRTTRLLLQSLLLGAGAWLALHDAVSGGAMIAASIIAGRALAPVEQLVANWRSIGSVRGALARCRETLAAVPSSVPRHQLPPPRGVLVVSNLYVTALGGHHPVLKGLSFHLEPGDALAVIGPSAAGKSTLARALVGVWPVHHGDIRLDGATLDQWDPGELGRHIGYLPQDMALFDGTIAENIARLDPHPDPKAVLAAAHAAGVHEMILRLQHGYATRVGDAGSAMPGGQRQRIALARALYGDPALIVMDEPNANLDAAGEAALTAAIARLRKTGRTVVVIAHRRAVLASVNRVLVLKDGKQAAFGSPEKVFGTGRKIEKSEAINDNRKPLGVGARSH